MDKVRVILGLFDAEPATGRVWWKKEPDPSLWRNEKWLAHFIRKRAGAPVRFYKGSNCGHLAVTVLVDGKRVTVLAHRIVWAVAFRDYPKTDIDHVNNDPTDNRISNLRLATRGQNADNAARRKPGLKGAYRGKNGRWVSAVWDGVRLKHLGTFPSQEQAHAAWLNAKAPIAGAFFNPGYPSVFD